MAWPGSANVEGGVTIDMRGLQGVKISADKKIVSVGAGETWGTVYEAIEKHGITVAGGRVNRLGAVGFMLGGLCPPINTADSGGGGDLSGYGD